MAGGAALTPALPGGAWNVLMTRKALARLGRDTPPLAARPTEEH